MTLPHRAHRKHGFLSKTKQESKSKTTTPQNIIPMELLYQRLGHGSRRYLPDGDNADVCQDIDIRVDPDPFCT